MGLIQAAKMPADHADAAMTRFSCPLRQANLLRLFCLKLAGKF